VTLAGKVAVVTGAARGLGRAIALTFARFGADLALCDRQAEDLAAVAAEIEAIGRRVTTAVIDVRDGEAVSAFVAEVVAHHGAIDVLVNNAGGGFWAPFEEVTAKGELALVRENFLSVTQFIRMTVPHLRPGSSIINITSIEAHRAGPGFAIYSAMKAAVANLTKSLALELSPRRIRINCIAPDVIPTPGDEGLGADSGALELAGVETQPWPETGHPDDCAGVAVFLATDLSRFVTGSSVHLDGGTWAAGGWKAKTGGGFTL
jgi:3-oxoacyl-[acyl-carrier protein] reductase